MAQSEMPSSLELIVAADRKMGIGREGDLPWRLKGDMAFFRETTQDSKAPVVIMGRRTWESIPERFRPLKGRYNIVLTRQREYSLPDNVGIAHTFEDAVALAHNVGDRYFIIGGGHIYDLAVASPDTHILHLTEVDAEVQCDTFLPSLEGFERVWTDDWIQEGEYRYRFTRWVRPPKA
jgi:dihydrofolate reductase/thymidylate synthase